MKSQLNKVIATGSWHSKRDCPDSPKAGKHHFRDISAKPGHVSDETLLTSQCQFCGGLIVDCPTIGLTAFTL